LDSVGIEPTTAYIHWCKAGALPLRQKPWDIVILRERAF
jgi:hypothetical protein